MFFLLMQISYPYIVFDNVPKIQENSAIVVEGYHHRGTLHYTYITQTRLLSVLKNEKITRTVHILKSNSTYF